MVADNLREPLRAGDRFRVVPVRGFRNKNGTKLVDVSMFTCTYDSCEDKWVWLWSSRCVGASHLRHALNKVLHARG